MGEERRGEESTGVGAWETGEGVDSAELGLSGDKVFRLKRKGDLTAEGYRRRKRK